MKYKERPKFYALHKEFNTGKIEQYDVLHVVFDSILTDTDHISKRTFYLLDSNWNKIPIRTKEQCYEFIKDKLMYHYWGNATWEYVAIDWPYRDTIKDSRPVKIDVYQQLEPNLPIIVDLVWDYIKSKVNRLADKEKKELEKKGK